MIFRYNCVQRHIDWPREYLDKLQTDNTGVFVRGSQKSTQQLSLVTPDSKKKNFWFVINIFNE